MCSTSGQNHFYKYTLQNDKIYPLTRDLYMEKKMNHFNPTHSDGQNHFGKRIAE